MSGSCLTAPLLQGPFPRTVPAVAAATLLAMPLAAAPEAPGSSATVQAWCGPPHAEACASAWLPCIRVVMGTDAVISLQPSLPGAQPSNLAAQELACRTTAVWSVRLPDAGLVPEERS